MPQSYPVRVYFHTGFNTGNIPSEPSILEQAEYKDYDAVFRFQSRDLATIRLNADWEDIMDADYARVGSADNSPVYYVVNSVVMLSGRTAELQITMDPLLSCGGVSSLTVVDGWLSRAHVGATEDELFNNILPEPWAPQNRLELVDEPQAIHEYSQEDTINVVGSTIDLWKILGYEALVFEAADSTTADAMYIPKLPPSEDFTMLSMLDHDFTLPGITLYEDKAEGDGANVPGLKNLTTALAVSIARSIGVDSAITSSYVLPKTGLDFETTLTGAVPVGYLVRDYKIKKITSTPVEYNSTSKYGYGTVKNKKALALYNTFTIMSASSGSSTTFESYEIFNNDAAPKFRVITDPSPTGTAYCQPKTFEGYNVKRLEHAVAGLPWLNSGMMMIGASGGALTIANAGRANRLIEHNQNIAAEKNALQGAAFAVRNPGAANPMLGKIGAGVSSVGGTVFNAVSGNVAGAIQSASSIPAAGQEPIALGYDYQQFFKNAQDIAYKSSFEMGDNLFSANVSSNVVAPEISFPVSINNSAYFGNSFIIYHVGLSDNDLARFDKFLTMFGYKVDKPLAKSSLNNRKHFNYIKTTEAHFTAPGVSAAMLSSLSDMINRGVRIWHELPNAAAFNDNPAKEGT